MALQMGRSEQKYINEVKSKGLDWTRGAEAEEGIKSNTQVSHLETG